MEELKKEIQELKTKEEKINKKIDELDEKGKFMESIIFLPQVFEIANKIKVLEKELMFEIGPDYTDQIVDLYYKIKEEKKDEYYYDIYLSNTRTLIGYIVYRDNNMVTKIGNIGYYIEEKYRNNGYAYKALNLINQKLLELEKENIIITTYEENIPSRKIIEKFGGKLKEKDKYNVLYYECEVKKINKNRR